ncbi:MAG: hypothetical protein AAGA58_11790 [Verrucomicrobiota bacterium]
MRHFLNHPLLSIFAPAILGFLGALLSVNWVALYGWSLFLGLPLAVSSLSSFLWCYGRKKSFLSAYGASIASILILGGIILVFAIDGLICLLMALPLALILNLLGTAIGVSVAEACSPRGGGMYVLAICVSFPSLVGFEYANHEEATVRRVTTSIEIKAPIEEVWVKVIQFPEIQEEPRGIFRLGIAYPISAHIEGEGEGAVRYCTFSTGSFVEPITRWEEPELLAFDVVENPPPMKEISFHEHVHANHLHGYMVSERGEFRLWEKDGQTILQGTTWYHHDLAPEFYWGAISDRIIQQIHLRVLTHIQKHAEATQ